MVCDTCIHQGKVRRTHAHARTRTRGEMPLESVTTVTHARGSARHRGSCSDGSATPAAEMRHTRVLIIARALRNNCRSHDDSRAGGAFRELVTVWRHRSAAPARSRRRERLTATQPRRVAARRLAWPSADDHADLIASILLVYEDNDRPAVGISRAQTGRALSSR